MRRSYDCHVAASGIVTVTADDENDATRIAENKINECLDNELSGLRITVDEVSLAEPLDEEI